MQEIDQWIDQFFKPVAEFVSGTVFYAEPFTGYDIKLILIWLAAASIFFTFYLGFINLRGFRHALKLITERSDPEEDGQINRFQALATSLSGTVGLGNIAGVAVAVSTGGPGAVLWMMVMGFFGMSSKFAEVTLGVKYRLHNDPEHPGRLSGGPMYYIRQGFENRGWKGPGFFMAGLFAVCGIGGAFGAGNMFQANQAHQQLINITGGEAGFWADKGWLFGILLAILVGVVIIGGLNSIARAASRIVPAMAALYIVTGLVVIALHWQNIPAALSEIVTLAFSYQSAFGGFLGALLIGVQRASFSNEAGLGSAAIVHSAVKTREPVSQGFVGMLGPFLDTIVICMVTALVIVITGAYTDSEGIEGVSLTSRAMESGIPGAQYILAMVVILFAYSTMITWSYYGQKCVGYLFGEYDRIATFYKLLFCGLIVIGASANLESVIIFSDAMVFAMGIPNIIGLYLLAPEIRRDLKDYWARARVS
jgi:AGCS family alanine or glycine:cation symporter